MSGGSTVGCVARSLAARGELTVVTNGLDTAAFLMARQLVQVVVTGGTAREMDFHMNGR
ncbi:hypothetical protein [Streptomyces microflavus]|uniref:hypothetical protein n=1 Tax=Streptomyces microflavus TaxID=1919 RepID=UPI0033EFE5E1